MALGRDVVSQGQTAFAGEKKSRPVGLCPGRFLARRNQALHRDNRVALKCSIAQFWHSPAVFPSDCLPDVPLQVFDSENVAGECPCYIRAKPLDVRLRDLPGVDLPSGWPICCPLMSNHVNDPRQISKVGAPHRLLFCVPHSIWHGRLLSCGHQRHSTCGTATRRYLPTGTGRVRTPDPLLRSYAVQNSKCRCWCRLRGSASFISPLNWTDVGPG